ncbi:MAG: hypothetical protein P1U42_02010 [Phycisphaerales bacterium]|nr:hypothetical protein [Phycisphaerales bacterium]
MVFRALGYIAVWPALYALGVSVLLWWLFVSQFPDALSIGYLLLCAHSCYLLDRVKVSDKRHDPADFLALPVRTMLFVKWAKHIRRLIVVEFMCALIAGWLIHPLLTLIPILALSVVHLYAGRSASAHAPRLKDLPGIKAFIIASGHISLAFAVLIANHNDQLSNFTLPNILILISIWAIVAGDAALCDIDDHDADKIYQTKSLSVLLGQSHAWMISLALIIAGSIAMIISEPAAMSYSFVILMTVSTLLTQKNTNHRDFVDARLFPITIFAIWI